MNTTYVIVKKMRWYHHIWNMIKVFLGKEAYCYGVLPNDDRPVWNLELDAQFLCPGCWEYVTWDMGCAHEDPDESKLCDNCWSKKRGEDLPRFTF